MHFISCLILGALIALIPAYVIADAASLDHLSFGLFGFWLFCTSFIAVAIAAIKFK